MNRKTSSSTILPYSPSRNGRGRNRVLRQMHIRTLFVLSGLLSARLAHAQIPSFAVADICEPSPEIVDPATTRQHLNYNNPYFLEQQLDREARKSPVRRAPNLKLPHPYHKPSKMTWGNFNVSPGVQAFDIPDSWINGTSNIHLVNVLFNFARRLHLFKQKPSGDDDDGR